MIPRAVHRTPGIYRTAEEKPRKTIVRRWYGKGFVTNHLIKWGPLFSNDDDRIAQHAGEGEDR